MLATFPTPRSRLRRARRKSATLKEQPRLRTRGHTARASWRKPASRSRDLNAFGRRPENDLLKLALENFANRTARQLFNDPHLRQTLHLAEPRVGPLLQGGAGHMPSAIDRHETDRRFAPTIRRCANNGCLAHRRMIPQDGLEIDRIDIDAARDDHILLAPDQREEAVRIHAPDVAGANVAFAVWAVPLGLGRLSGLVVIAFHHRR